MAIYDTTTEEGFRKLREYFYQSNIVDNQIGKILKALDESGESDNTIIIFIEHGEMGEIMECWKDRMKSLQTYHY